MTSRWVSTPNVGKNNGRNYDVQRSPTATPYPNETFYLGFPQSSVSGIVVEDTVEILDGDVQLGNFSFGVVYQESSGIKDQPFDGFLGLETILDSKPTFFESLIPTLPSPTFALDFKTSTTNSTGPSMQFGGIDPTKFTTPLAYTSIDRSTNRWTANNITFSIRGQLMPEAANMSFDTGGDNNIYAPMSIVAEYYSQVPGLLWGSQLGGFNCTVIIPCASELPDFEMHIGNGTAVIHSGHMFGRSLTGPANPAWSKGANTLKITALVHDADGKQVLGTCASQLSNHSVPTPANLASRWA
ncbi:MAG: hypothetical protein Q9170_002426 [Blastenia crenularia]